VRGLDSFNLGPWNHRNDIVFKNAKVDVEEIFYMAQLRVWVWLKCKSLNMNFSYTSAGRAFGPGCF